MSRPSIPQHEFLSDDIIHLGNDITLPPITWTGALRLATYNIGYASGIKNNTEKITEAEAKQNLYTIALTLKKIDADIVALQEVDFKSARTFDTDQMTYLAQFLGMPFVAYAVTWNKKYIPFPYWPISKHFGRILSGQVILSKYPLVKQEVRTYEKPKKNWFWYNWFYLNRVEQKVIVQLPIGNAAIWNVHLEAYDSVTREEQAELLSDAINKEDASMKFVLGDFNGPTAMAHVADKTSLKNSDTSLLTYPSWNPIEKLDAILYPNSFEMKNDGALLGTAVSPPLGSDHLPVWKEFLIKQ